MERRYQETIASQCAPVLMDVKPSNLLILTKEEEAYFLQMEQVPGISYLRLHAGEKKSTWLLYRADALEAVLMWPQVRSFLHTWGYHPEWDSMNDMLEKMAGRFADYKESRIGFPHELGIFLGYPLGDVKGFIEHQGKNYLCSGYWKVYQNEHKARHTFQLYQAMKEKVLQMVSEGVRLQEISCFAY